MIQMFKSRPQLSIRRLIIPATIGLLLIELLFRLASLTHGKLSSAEVSTIDGSNSIAKLLANPLYAPYKIIEYGLAHCGLQPSVLLLRMASVFWAIIAVVLIYNIISRWFGRRSGLFTAVLFATSIWFLQTARLATVDILYMVAPLSLLALVAWQRQTEDKSIKTAPVWVCCFVIGLGLYVPAFIWLLLLVLLLQPRLIKHSWITSSRLSQYGGLIGLLVLLVPLVRAIILRPKLGLWWLGLMPDNGTAHTAVQIGRRFLDVPLVLFVRVPSATSTGQWLGRLPLLPAAMSILFIIGCYACIRYSRRKGWLLAMFLIISWLLVAICNTVSISLLYGQLFIIMSAGITYLLRLWLRVFPRNPLARRVSLIAMSLLVTSLVLFGWHGYFVAWAHDASVESYYQQKL